MLEARTGIGQFQKVDSVTITVPGSEWAKKYDIQKWQSVNNLAVNIFTQQMPDSRPITSQDVENLALEIQGAQERLILLPENERQEIETKLAQGLHSTSPVEKMLLLRYFEGKRVDKIYYQGCLQMKYDQAKIRNLSPQNS